MALLPEEKKKIYEEEKARMEAQERIRKEKNGEKAEKLKESASVVTEEVSAKDVLKKKTGIFNFVFGTSKEEQKANFRFIILLALALAIAGYFGVLKWMALITLLIAAIAIYFAPSDIAWGKKGRNGIIALNILLGWTFIGWVVALCWALAAEKND